MQKKLFTLYLKEIYKIKFYLIFVFFLNFAIFYYLFISEPKLFQSKVVLNSLAQLDLKINKNPDIQSNILYDIFLIKLKSKDNLIEFLHDKNYKELFNKYLNKKKIPLEEYLEENININTNQNLIALNKTILPIIIFNYPEDINGHDILNDYIKYSFIKNFSSYKNIMIDHNLTKLKLLEEKIKLLSSNLNKMHIDDYKTYNQFQLTTIQIKNNLKELNNIDVTTYNPIIDKGYKTNKIFYPKVDLFIFFGILSYTFLSILILTIRLFC